MPNEYLSQTDAEPGSMVHNADQAVRELYNSVRIGMIALVRPEDQALVYHPIVIVAGRAHPVGNFDLGWYNAAHCASFANGARRAIVGSCLRGDWDAAFYCKDWPTIDQVELSMVAHD